MFTTEVQRAGDTPAGRRYHRHQRVLPLALWALGASVVNVLLLTIALLRPAPFRVEVGEPGDAYVVASFHRPEGRFRWSAPGSALLVPAAYDGPLAVELRLHAAPAAGPDERVLRLGRDGASVATMVTTPEWRVYRLLLPPSRSELQDFVLGALTPMRNVASVKTTLVLRRGKLEPGVPLG